MEGLMHFVAIIKNKMKSYYVPFLALLLSLGSSGIPLHNPELQAMADRGLGAAMAEVNTQYSFSHLYRVTRGSVSRVVPMGMNTLDLLMTFGVKETECAKGSTTNPQTCAFRPGLFVPTLSCSSRVRMSASAAQVVSLRCGRDGSSSSSSSSSEEIFSRRGRHQFNIPSANRAVPASPTPFQPSQFLHRQTAEEVQPRGESFSNYLA